MRYHRMALAAIDVLWVEWAHPYLAGGKDFICRSACFFAQSTFVHTFGLFPRAFPLAASNRAVYHRGK